LIIRNRGLFSSIPTAVLSAAKLWHQAHCEVQFVCSFCLLLASRPREAADAAVATPMLGMAIPSMSQPRPRSCFAGSLCALRKLQGYNGPAAYSNVSIFS
jgi:hypothetical protein